MYIYVYMYIYIYIMCVCFCVSVCTFMYVLVTYSEGKKKHIWRTFSYYLSIILQLVYCH